MRQMATVQKIVDLQSIEGADRIERATVRGWHVVVNKGQYQVGDLVVYCEIDSWIPHDVAPFLTKDGQEPREYNGIKGEKLRTIRLRKQISQGLILPLSVLGADIDGVVEGDDVSERLAIVKYEPPISVSIGKYFRTRGTFPDGVPKTDQERIQNVPVDLIQRWVDDGDEFEVTEKAEGMSSTMYLDRDGVFYVCSRNLSVAQDDNNPLWQLAVKYNVERQLRDALLFGVAIQGEVVGPGIQGNIYNLTDVDFYVFDVYDVVRAEYLSPVAVQSLCLLMQMKHVPVISQAQALTTSDRDWYIDQADGTSMITPGVAREGIVYKSCNGRQSFKAISNKYLLKHS